MNSDKPWISCTCNADLPNANLHSIIQLTQCQMESDLAVAPPTVVEHLEAAVAALMKIPVAGRRIAEATTITKTLPHVAVVLIAIDLAALADNSTIPGATLPVTRARNVSR